jgi:hypothetical protein
MEITIGPEVGNVLRGIIWMITATPICGYVHDAAVMDIATRLRCQMSNDPGKR